MDFRIKIKETYDQISEKYDQVRRQPWKDLIEFIEAHGFFDECYILLDLGCGNGRHTNLFADKCNSIIGLELSNELLKIAKSNCRTNNTFFINGDALHLPFRDNIFSNIIYVAAIHHLSNEKQRENSLIELKRVLSSRGKAIITAWRRYQEEFLIIFLIDLLFLNFKKRGLEFGDIFIPWHGSDKKIIANRFYHLFTMRELKNLLSRTRLKILECKYFSGKSRTANIITLFEKEL
ncbi:MAG: class I SAM-dependent methyltransferase [Promethearchaeota archaeon]